MSLIHKTIYEDPSYVMLSLQLIDDLKVHHENGTFPLVYDPNQVKKALFLGMFVLRPMNSPYIEPIIDPVSNKPESMFHVKNGWSYNVKGLEGGWLIANRSVVDAYRLGFQYGISDAVIIGSRSVCEEGCDPLPSEINNETNRRGYVWQPYGPLEWPHVKALDEKLVEKVENQRKLWQNQGFLSSRKYPAQIIITWSGEKYESSRDFLEARIFNEIHPDGSEFEVYIITSIDGATNIRNRAKNYGFNFERLEKILIIVSSPENPKDINLKNLPELLYSKYDMRLIDHDGGQYVLDKFIQAGIIPQMNLTLGRKLSLQQVLESSPILTSTQRTLGLQNFPNNVSNFFSGQDGLIPKTLIPFSILVDEKEDVVVVCFESSKLDKL